jgi:ABC-2 type transport system ATP-binding protein
MAENAFEFENASKTYHLWRRLRKIPVTGIVDVSLAVPRGIIFGLLGLNGAGKTTAMKLLVGLLAPDHGRVLVLGGTVSDPGVRARIGYLPELPYLPMQLDVMSLLKYYGMMSGLRGMELSERIGQALELTGLDPDRRDPVRYYSKGQRQRAAMAQVLLHRPDVIFVDEPMSGLDPQGIRDMRELLINLRTSGVTVCLNSHQISEVERLCDRVGILAAGRLVREGAVGDLLALARRREYRLTLLVAGRRSGKREADGPENWRIADITVGEERLAATLTAQRKKGSRVLQILSRQGSLEEVLLEAVRGGSVERNPGDGGQKGEPA